MHLKSNRAVALSTTAFSRAAFKTLCLGAAVCFIPAAASATVIVLEPDHFPVGTDLSNASPYVTLQSLDGGYGSGPVYATLSTSEFDAPTGELVFGNFPGGWADCEGHLDCAQGFGMIFHQPIDWVSLKAINTGYGFPGEFGLSATWLAFDANGDYLTDGYSFGASPDNLGIPFSLDLAIQDMTSLVVGGSTQINALQFDELSFGLSPVDVPEPTTLALLGLGLVGLAFARRRQHRRTLEHEQRHSQPKDRPGQKGVHLR